MATKVKLFRALLAAAAVGFLAAPVHAAQPLDRDLLRNLSISDGTPYGELAASEARPARGVAGRAGIESPKAMDAKTRDFLREASVSDGTPEGGPLNFR